jgi:hypothetical protein
MANYAYARGAKVAFLFYLENEMFPLNFLKYVEFV